MRRLETVNAEMSKLRETLSELIRIFRQGSDELMKDTIALIKSADINASPEELLESVVRSQYPDKPVSSKANDAEPLEEENSSNGNEEPCNSNHPRWVISVSSSSILYKHDQGLLMDSKGLPIGIAHYHR
jgi:hypothetical protein